MRIWRVAAVWMLCAAFGCSLVGAESTHGYRGPQGNGIFDQRGLLKAWPPGGPRLLWKHPLPIGYAGATVVDDRIYITGGGGGCHLYEISLEGSLLTKIPCGGASWKRFSGPRSNPVIRGNTVVTTTPNADVFGLDLEQQTIRWRKNAWKDFGSGLGNQGWGMPESPILVDDKVVFNPVSRDDQTPPIVAVDVHTGQIVWQADIETGRKWSAADVSGTCFTHNGRKIIAWPCWRSFLVLDARTGKKLWEFADPKGSEKTLTAVYADGYLLTMPRGNICRMVKLSEDGASCTPLWERPYRGSFSQAVILDRRVWMFGDATDKPRAPQEGEPEAFARAGRGEEKRAFLCLDAETGEAIQTYPSAEAGHVIAADGMVYTVEKLRSRRGTREAVVPRVRLIRPRPAGFEITGEFIPPVTDGELSLRDVEWEANASPTIAQHRLFLRYGALWCYDLRAEPAWSGFRGDGTGVALLAKPPQAWMLPKDATWACDLPAANCSPIVPDGDRVHIVSGTDLVSINSASGKVAWRQQVARGPSPTTLPSPLARDGQVYVVSSDGSVACFDRAGKSRWTAATQPSTRPATPPMASPLVCEDVVVVQGRSLVGYSADKGELLWTVPLPDDLACGTPVATRINQYDGRGIALLSCGMTVGAADGRVYARYNARDRGAIPAIGLASPVVSSSRAYYCGNRADGAVVGWFDVETPDKERRTQLGRNTKLQKDVAFVCSPLVLDGLVYVLTARQELMVFDESWAVVYRQSLSGGAWPDMAPELRAAGGVVYAVGIGAGDQVVAVRGGRKFEKLWETRLPDRPVGLAFHGNTVYVRAGQRLYAIVRPADVPTTRPATTLPGLVPTTRPQ